MAPHSSTLAWKILWTEEPGGLQSMGLLLLSSHGRGIAPQDALKKDSRGLLRVGLYLLIVTSVILTTSSQSWILQANLILHVGHPRTMALIAK